MLAEAEVDAIGGALRPVPGAVGYGRCTRRLAKTVGHDRLSAYGFGCPMRYIVAEALERGGSQGGKSRPKPEVEGRGHRRKL